MAWCSRNTQLSNFPFAKCWFNPLLCAVWLDIWRTKNATQQHGENSCGDNHRAENPKEVMLSWNEHQIDMRHFFAATTRTQPKPFFVVANVSAQRTNNQETLQFFAWRLRCLFNGSTQGLDVSTWRWMQEQDATHLWAVPSGYLT